MENISTYEIRVNGQKIDVKDPILTGKELLDILGFEPATDFEVLLKLTAKEFEPVQLNEKVDLRKPGIETFQVRPYRHLVILVDDEPVRVTDCYMTPKEILQKVEKDPESFYLKQIIGHREVTYKNDPDHKIAIKNGLKFSTCKREPTTVS